MSDDLADGVGLALGEDAEDYDIDAITEALREAGAKSSVDDVSGPAFWDIVSRHLIPPEEEAPTPLDQFKAEMRVAAQTEVGVNAVWQRGGVTLEVSGHSRVSMLMPQVIATYQLTVVGSEPVRLTPGQVESWSRLWETVESRLYEWTAAVEEARKVYEAKSHEARLAREKADRAAGEAERARRELAVLQPEPATMSKDEVADYYGIAPGSVAREMSRAGIEAVLQRGPSGRAQARYPTAAVKAHKAQRPGRGHRSDLG
ncbi:hypothetical protein ACFWGI_06560 [Streptomyces niveus]|uniref:hypothetical protein n=1 Tax=Streptomyces niveus TaxID=193462 RepID=UPI00365E10B1